MTIGEILLLAYLCLGLIYWLYTAYAVVRTRRALRALEEMTPGEPAVWPKLSIVVPARNEADKLEQAFRTLLDQDYPDLEIILIDDRSTDGTGEIVDRMAAGDSRVKAVHVTQLPEGWVGKVNALNRGLVESSGELVLFTDADVHFGCGLLRKAVAYVLDQGLDHLTAFPRLWRAGIATDAMIGVFIRQIIVAAGVWDMRDGPPRSCIGIGAFNMVRRSAFGKTEGFEWLRMETADDFALAYLMKRSGARCDVVTAFPSLGLHWYRSIGEAAVGAEKGYSSAFRCSLPLVVIASLLMAALELSPLVSLASVVPARHGLLAGIGAANVLLYLFSTIALGRWAGVRILPPLLGPVMAPVLAALTIRVGILGHRRGGVMWRGTLYRSDELRKGRRVPL